MTTIGPFSAALTGLAANTTYHYRAVATAGSQKAYGSDATFTTSPAASGAGNTTGTVASTPAATGSPNEYALYFNITSTTVTGLSAGQQIQVAATTIDFPNLLTVGATLTGDLDHSLGWWVLKKANGSTPTLAVSTLNAINIGANTAELLGNLTNLGGAATVNAFFQYGTTTSYGNTTTAFAMNMPSEFYAVIRNLTASTAYHFRSAVTDGSTTVYGEDKSFTTQSPVATLTVYTASVNAVTANSANLVGNLGSMGNATSANVYFDWGQTTSYGTSTTAFVKTAPGSYNTTITGLSPNTTYHFRTTATDGNITVHGDDYQFTTLTATPAPRPSPRLRRV